MVAMLILCALAFVIVVAASGYLLMRRGRGFRFTAKSYDTYD